MHEQFFIVQVAGMVDQAEGEMLVHQGVTHIGLPLGPGVREQDMSLDEVARIVKILRGQVQFVLITYLTIPEEIAVLCQKVGADGVQLHADLEPDQVARLRVLQPDLFIIKSLVVGEGGDVLTMAKSHAPNVDAFLTDTFDPATGARGATGMTHDWAVSRSIVQAVDRPVILAGGLTQDNVAAAILATGVAGVDAHTGLEDECGRKDAAKVRLFVQRAHQAIGERA